MRVIRGKDKGRTFRVHQAANDWLSVDFDDGGHGIVTPANVECSLDEWKALFEMAGGTFGVEWTWEDDRIIRPPWPLRYAVMSEDGTAYGVTPNTREAADHECALLRENEPCAVVVVKAA